jgi:hypothetical protein
MRYSLPARSVAWCGVAWRGVVRRGGCEDGWPVDEDEVKDGDEINGEARRGDGTECNTTLPKGSVHRVSMCAHVCCTL